MKRVLLVTALLLSSCASWRGWDFDETGGNTSPEAQGQSFRSFMVGLEAEAITRGLSADKLRISYGNQKIAPNPAPAKAEKKQAEFQGDLQTYLNRVVNPTRVAKGKALMNEHKASLAAAAKQTGVPQPMLVALWAIESDYGRNTGSMPLLPTLISMAYQAPRHAMFRTEVFAALQLPEVETLKGSWAGATGQCQFMPTNVLKYATDGNADGVADIWNTEADVFASSGTFIKALGYRANVPWRLKLPHQPNLKGIDLNARGLSEPLTLQEWQERGAVVSLAAFKPTDKLRYYQPTQGGPSYLTTPTYEAVLGWNYSSFFATSVFKLAEALD